MDKEPDEPQINSPDQIAKIHKEMETKLSSSFVNLGENKSMLYYNTTRETKNENVINNLFDDNKFNKENLEYINKLLKAKEVEKEKTPTNNNNMPINQYNIKISSSNINMNNHSASNHKKSSTSIDQPIEKAKINNDKFNNSVDNPISKNWNPFAKKHLKDDKTAEIKTPNDNDNKQEVEQENSTKRDRIKSLFERDAKKTLAETNEKKNVNNSLNQTQQRDSSYSFRTNKKDEGFFLKK